MKIIRVLSTAILMGHVGLGMAAAQTLKTEIPAELPPSSYSASQYVDSRGCVYIRAGIDGNVTWVPRMTRSREHICNAKPTAVARASAPAERQQAAAQPPVALPAPSDAPRASAPRARPEPAAARETPAAPRRVSAPASQPKPKAAPQPRRVTVAAAPKPRVMRPAAPQARQIAVPARKSSNTRAPAVRRVTAADGCRWASAASAQYMRGEGVRCGPQAMHPVTGATDVVDRARTAYVGNEPDADPREASRTVRITPNTRVVPLHVAKMQDQAAEVGRVPPGYRLVWEDDRLNPQRAHQTLAGKRQMDLRWTRDVPRRLIDISTGRDVTAFNPDLVYPYTSMEQQQTSAKRPQGYLSTKSRAAASKPTVSTRSAPPAVKPDTGKALKVAVSHRYVQVGRYGSDAEAQRDAARLGRAGLVVRMGTLHSNGGTARVLLAGPYASPQALGNALHAARRAGFGNAFTRQ